MKLNDLMDVCWNVVYWGGFLMGSFVVPFFQGYWTAGHFSAQSRAKFSLLRMARLSVIALAVFVTFVIAGCWLFDQKFTAVAKNSILIMSNLYGMVVLVALLSYGLTALPYSLWHQRDSKSVLYESLADADEIYRAYRDARVDFHTEVSLCRNLIAGHTNGFNKQFMDILEAEIPSEDLDGDTIHTSKAFMVDVKKGRDVDESFIAERRNSLKIKFFLYKRKKARWQSVFGTISDLTVEPKSIEQAYLTRKIELQKQGSNDSFFILNLRL